jgi:crotonobetainyl-CoA:carnitine CoA-transferase CaiB-like acyl-CoA transferase
MGQFLRAHALGLVSASMHPLGNTYAALCILHKDADSPTEVGMRGGLNMTHLSDSMQHALTHACSTHACMHAWMHELLQNIAVWDRMCSTAQARGKVHAPAVVRDAVQRRQRRSLHERRQYALAHDVVHNALRRAEDAAVCAGLAVAVDHLRAHGSSFSC